MKPFLLVALLLATALAGCSSGGDDGGGSAGGQTTGPIKSGKGAISGLLINDVFRPVPGGLILIQELGLTTTSDESGQFAFTDIEPGAYMLRVQAEGHEAAPQSVEVQEGEYAEAEIIARRIVNEAGRIVTSEFSVFIPCAFSTPVALVTFNCVLDLSGDTFRSSTPGLNFTGFTNATYLVGEIKINQPGNFVFTLRPEGSDTNGTSWGDVTITEGDYGKITLKRGEQAPDGTHAWNNNNPDLEAGLFYNGQVANPGLPNPLSYGIGGTVGIKAKIILSLFVGEPEVDINTYCVLC